MRRSNALRPSIARGPCLRGAFTLLNLVALACLAGCGGGSGGGSSQKSTQSIAFTQPKSPITYAPALTASLSATATSGLSVAFSVDSASTGKGTISGDTLTVTAAGKLVIDANQSGNSSYDAAEQVQVSIVVNKASPTVSAWPTASAITTGAALSTSTLTGGTASVPGTFAWTAPSTVPAVGTDSESVTFTPTDTTDYTTVTADVSVVVNKAALKTPTVSAWPTASAITTGQALSASTLTGGKASVPGTFAWTTPSTVPAVGTDSESVTFTPTDTTDYTTATASVQVVVNKASLKTPTVSAWPTASAITTGQALSASTLTGGKASVPGTFAWTTPSTVPAVGTDSESVTFTPTDTTGYTTATASVQIVVNKAALKTPTVSAWPTASAITTGQALSASTLTGGTASVPGTFVWTTPSTVPAVGTDSESVTFTPTDTTDYTTATASVQIVVNPSTSTPQITAFTPRYAVGDDTITRVNGTITCPSCLPGDIQHDVTGIFANLTWPSSSATQGYLELWQEGNFQPTWDTIEIQHPSGAFGNQWSSAFMASASQSTLAISPTTGTLFEDEQASGQIDWQATNGTTGKFFSDSVDASSPTLVAVDDVTGKVSSVITGTSTASPYVEVFDENGDGGVAPCYITPTGMTFISSIAARGGYMVFTDPVENLVGSAKMDCSGYTTVSLAGQPWSIAMTNNGTETDAYVLARDASAADGKPAVVKYVVPAMTVAGSVELDIPTITSIRNATPLEGVRQIVAFTNTPVLGLVSMDDSTDGEVLLVSTDTSNGKKMAITHTVSVPELPFALATQENTSASTLWVAYITATGGDNITHAGTIDPATGNYTPAVGTCPAGVLAGGFAASATQVYCAQGGTIAPLQQ